MVTFGIDDVKPVLDRLPAQRLADRIPTALAIARDPELAVIDHGPTHALLGAVHLAFSQHRPLTLSPDAIWLTIAQGVAHHVRLHAERLRPRMVRHADTKALVVPAMEVPTDATGWAALVPRFRALIAEQVGDGRARLLECDFSTTTDVDRVASQIVLMDVYAPYFDYWLMCICGIPSITLTGTADDWHAIRRRIEVIAELDLATWTRSLAPILDQFVRAAEGAADVAFWQRIFKPQDAYGGDIITGWIARLYPYLESAGTATRENPLLALPIDQPRGNAATGIRSSDVLAGPCSVRINIAGATATTAVQLQAGVTIVVQDAQGYLVPMSNWSLHPARAVIQDIADRIRADHKATPAASPEDLEGSADVVGFYNLLGSARIGAWSVRAASDHVDLELEGEIYVHATRMIDCADGRFIVHAQTFGDNHWVLFEHEGQPLESLPIIGSSLVDVLTAILDTGEPPPAKRMLGDVAKRRMPSRPR